MKFKIKRILAVMLVLCMMMGMVPNMLMTAYAAGKTTVDQIKLSGIYLPEADKPCYAIDSNGVTTPSDAAYEFSPQYAYYYDAGGNTLTGNEKFEAGRQYYTEILIRIKSEYVDTHAFSADSKPTITFTDIDKSLYKNYSVSFLYIEDSWLKAKIDFTLAGDNAYSPINTLVLDDYKTPVNGQTLYEWYYDSNVPEYNNSKMTSLKYLMPDGTEYYGNEYHKTMYTQVETGEKYGLEMKFKAVEEYAFADVVNISVGAGNPTITYTVSADKKTLTVELLEEVPGPDITSIEFGLNSPASVIDGNTVMEYVHYWVTESSDKYYAEFNASLYEWKDEAGNIVTGQKFENGKKYIGKFDFRAETGHSFADDVTINITSGGKYVSHKVIKNKGYLIELEVTVTPGEPTQPPVTPPATTYTITATAGEGGTITPSGEVTVNKGDGYGFAIKPNEGYKIKDVIVDGTSVGVVTAYGFSNVEANHIIEAVFETTSVTPPADTTINSVDATVEVPEAGETPANATVNTTGAKIFSTDWYYGDTQLDADDKFESGKTYKCVVIVHPEDGYKFADGATLEINDKAATVVASGSDFINAYVEFKVTATISAVEATVKEPEAGETPANATVNTTGAKIFSTDWYYGDTQLDADDKFEGGKTYKCVVIVHPEDGYKFADGATLEINDKAATVVASGSDFINAYVEFEVETPAPVKGDLNVIESNGVLTWPDYPGATHYALSITGYAGLDNNIESGFNLRQYLSEHGKPYGEYAYSIVARDDSLAEISNKHTATYDYQAAGETPDPTPTVSIPETLALKVGESSTLTATGDYEGYTPSWSSDNEAVATVDENGKVTAVAAGTANITVTLDAGATRTTISDTCVVTVTKAEPEVETYTVYFFLDKNDEFATSFDDVEAGQTATAPEDPAPEGKTFLGWYTSDDIKFDFSTPINSNLNLYAKFGDPEEPELEPVVIEIPVSKKVINGGNVAFAGEETFEFIVEVLNSNVEEFTVEGNSIKVTNSEGGSTIIEITVPGALYDELCDEGLRITEAVGEAEGWTYSEESYLVMVSPNGQRYMLEGAEENTDVESIVFTNTYTENKTEDPEKPVYGIVVNNGKSYTGAGVEISAAEEGTKITIKANEAPEGKEFDKWVVNNGTITLADATKAETTFDMPAERVQVTATYKDKVVTPPADDDNNDDTDKPSDDNKDDESKPSDTNKPTTDTESPKTGDTSNIFMWFAVLFVSGFALVGFTLFGRKRRA